VTSPRETGYLSINAAIIQPVNPLICGNIVVLE
jgi:hypothetical protein